MAALVTQQVVADGILVFDSYGAAGTPASTPGSGDPFERFFILNSQFDNFFVFNVNGTAGAAAPTGQGESSTGGRGGVAPWPSGYKYPYEKWWKKKKAQDLKKLKEAAEKKIAELERKAEEARRRIELARTIEAIAKATEVMAKFEQTLQDERNNLAEIEMLEFAIVWAIYKQSLYLQ